MELLKEAYITIILEENTNSIVLDWIGAPTSDQFKQGKEYALQAIRERGINNLILNYQNLTAYLNLEIQVWTIHDWFDQVLTSSIKKIGVVTPSNIMAQIVVKSIFGGISQKTEGTEIDVNFFESDTSVSSWISGGTTQQSTPVSTNAYTATTTQPVDDTSSQSTHQPYQQPTTPSTNTTTTTTNVGSIQSESNNPLQESYGGSSFKGVDLNDSSPEEKTEYIPPKIEINDDPFADF